MIIRQLINDGFVRRANFELGSVFGFEGKVVKGAGRGKDLTFPTANVIPLEKNQLMPKKGVYFIRGRIIGLQAFGMCNFGVRPTFDEKELIMEIHFFHDKLGNLYGQEIRVEFLERIRDEKKFPSSEILIKQLEIDKLNRKGKSFFSISNEMIRFQIIQIVFVYSIFYFYGFDIMIYFMICSIIGFLLLETVNYIEHYGLERNLSDNDKYERVQPFHSWNSNHPIGRIMLFELSRHSDHHYNASRKYQILKNHDNSPEMPTGYPGMMILALFPPLWFYVMNNRIKNIIK